MSSANRSGRWRELLPVAAGAAFVVAAAGAGLAFTDLPSPLRAPFTVFFLVVAPAAAVAGLLRGLEPPARVVVSAAAALALNLLVAQAMLAMHLWSVRGGVVAVAGISALLILFTLVRRPGGRTARRQGT
ncbi:hypothetical protein [Streptomyces candidus]|uniref:Uncharacterized protein n=1 Tax=Streptomyces candidus TaxID=67283 RepID=A0A7X0HF57_9ACTN|nr:hypothetical protein [Streptomyces candidus]MBB6436510.1 hypothetical protein [Streptomyces candidus]